jgi:putative transposase
VGLAERTQLIQRCQVHKLRNVQAHLPEKHHAQLVTQLSTAYHETNYGAALAQLQTTIKWVERLSPDAAASLREGLKKRSLSCGWASQNCSARRS